MSLVRTVTQGAPGGVLLLFYLVGTGWLWLDLNLQYIVPAAAVIAFCYLLLIELASDFAIGFVALPVIFRVKQKIDQKIGSENFYFGHEDKKAELTEYDDKTFRYTTVVYTGALIALTAPVQGYVYPNAQVTLVGIGIGIFACILCYLSFINMRKVIETSVRLYK